jgi:NAD(P)-dependent dehydrogenase (short-subunit alcohol dehydrogenase family)/ketosteroid isomerase-like protein
MATNEDNSTSRTWLVTGASRGFGKALSEAVLSRGEQLVATARSRDFTDSFAREHPDALAVPLDVTEVAQARVAVDQAVERFGRIDVVVNNAGYGHFGAVEELSEEELRRQFEVNLFGLLNVTRAALPVLRRQRSGHLVQMSSLNGIEGMVGGAYYCASKFAVEGLSESLAAEIAHLGIKVTIVEPGPHRTTFASAESARIADPIDDYAESVGEAREAFAEMDGTQPGDPALAAAAIVEAVDADEPPLRLPLGQMALDGIRAKLTGQLEELERWARLSASSDRSAPLRRAYRAFNERDVEAAVAVMSPEVSWPDVGEGGFVHGRDGVREHWREQFEAVDPTIEPGEFRSLPDGRVAVSVRQVVRSDDGALVSDESLVHLYTLRDGLIDRMEIVEDPRAD